MKRLKSFVSQTYSRLRPQPHFISLFYSTNHSSLLHKIAHLKPQEFLAIRDHHSNCTILDLAIKQGRLQLIQNMASQMEHFSAVLNDKNNEEGLPPVCRACDLGDLPILKILHQHGAHLFEQTSEVGCCLSEQGDVNILHIAAHKNQIRILDYALRNLDQRKDLISARTTQNATPMTLAFLANNFDSINLLMSHGVSPFQDLNEENQNMNLLYLINSDDLDLFSILYQTIQELEIRNLEHSGSMGMLHLCAQLGAYKILQFLLKQGHIPSQVCNNVEQSTPLHFATLSNKFADGNSALHLAILTKQTEIVKLLLQFGANPQLKNVNDQSPLEMAEFEGNTTIRYLLKSKN